MYRRQENSRVQVSVVSICVIVPGATTNQMLTGNISSGMPVSVTSDLQEDQILIILVQDGDAWIAVAHSDLSRSNMVLCPSLVYICSPVLFGVSPCSWRNVALSHCVSAHGWNDKKAILDKKNKNKNSQATVSAFKPPSSKIVFCVSRLNRCYLVRLH